MDTKEENNPIAANIFKGVLIGVANVIPGVSGGTIAVVTGIYEPLIERIGKFFSTYGGWKKNLAYLAPVVLGIFIGLAGFAQVIGYLLDSYPEQTMYFFIGLILGSLPFLIKTAGRHSFKAVYLAPLAITLTIMILTAFTERPPAGPPIREITVVTGLMVFLTGVIATGTMVIPGISGSFILLLIGMYTTFVAGLREGNIVIISIFMTGAVIGIITVTKVIEFLLRRFHALTYYGIIGLVAGSLLNFRPGFTPGPAGVASIGTLILGCLLAYFLGSDRRILSGK